MTLVIATIAKCSGIIKRASIAVTAMFIKTLEYLAIAIKKVPEINCLLIDPILACCVGLLQSYKNVLIFVMMRMRLYMLLKIQLSVNFLAVQYLLRLNYIDFYCVVVVCIAMNL